MKQSTLQDFESDGVECPTCGRADFEEKGHMKLHHTEAHGESIAGRPVECTNCGSEFRRPEGNSTESENEFCSQDCYHSWTGEEGVLAGENNPQYKEPVELKCEQCGSSYEVPPVHSDSRFCSEDCKHEWLSTRTGRKHPLWDGGTDWYTSIRQELGPTGWHTLRKKNLKDICEMCGSKTSPNDRDLSLHHIVPILSGGTNDEYNFMTLCEPCHSNVESYCSNLPGFESFLVE